MLTIKDVQMLIDENSSYVSVDIKDYYGKCYNVTIYNWLTKETTEKWRLSVIELYYFLDGYFASFKHYQKQAIILDDCKQLIKYGDLS